MAIQNLLIIIGIVIVSLGFLAFVFHKLFGKDITREYMKQYQVVIKDKKEKPNKAYEFLKEKPLIGKYLRWLRAKIFLMEGSIEENALKSKTLIIGVGSLLSSLAIYALLIRIYNANLYMSFLMLIACVLLNQLIISTVIGGSDVRLLEKLIEYLNDVKHYYHVSGMVDEAIYDANIKCRDSNMLSHGKKIYEVITSKDPENNLRLYYNRGPNKFLKIFAGFSYLIKEYGDKKVNGVSLYIKNMNFIIEEIQLEILKTNQLAYWLKGLKIIVLFPLILPPLIEWWARASFPVVSEFYDSSLAFFIKCFIFFMVIVCYLLIDQIQKNEYKNKEYKQLDKTNMYKLSQTSPFKDILKVICPKENTDTHRRLLALLESAGSPLTVEIVYLKRFLYGLLAFVLLLTVFIKSHDINVQKIMSDSTYGVSNKNFLLMMGKLDKDHIDENIDINKTDEQVINMFRKFKNSMSSENLKNKIVEELNNRNHTYQDVNIAAERIFAKIEATSKEHFKIWEFLLVIFVSFLVTKFPELSLIFQAKLRKVDMEDEVFQFHTIIILLMYHERTDVELILEWMKHFSNIFYSSIDRCLTNFQNPKAALDKLKEDVKFKPLVNLVDNLQMAIDKIDIASAFDSLELDRDFYKENRKEANKQVIDQKIEFGRLIGFAPIYAVLVLYLMLPILWVSFTSMTNIQQQLNSK